MSTVRIERAIAAWPQVEPTLRMPHNEREYRQLVKLLDRLVDEVGEDEDHPLASMMEVLGVLIERYEDHTVPELTTSFQSRAALTQKPLVKKLAANSFKDSATNKRRSRLQTRVLVST